MGAVFPGEQRIRCGLIDESLGLRIEVQELTERELIDLEINSIRLEVRGEPVEAIRGLAIAEELLANRAGRQLLPVPVQRKCPIGSIGSS